MFDELTPEEKVDAQLKIAQVTEMMSLATADELRHALLKASFEGAALVLSIRRSDLNNETQEKLLNGYQDHAHELAYYKGACNGDEDLEIIRYGALHDLARILEFATGVEVPRTLVLVPPLPPEREK